MYLEKINKPNDVKELSNDELLPLAAEIREQSGSGGAYYSFAQMPGIPTG